MSAVRHAELGASRAERWMHCPGSVRMARQVPDVDTPYAAEGREAHALAEQIMRAPHYGDPAYVFYPDAPEDMLAPVMVYTNYVAELAKGKELRIEVTFDLSALAPPEPMYGTADAVVTGNRRLDVIDFKYGAGVLVEVNDNPQLLYYVLGALVGPYAGAQASPKDVLETALAEYDEMWVHIVQPRASHADGPIRTSRIEHQTIRDYAAHLILKAGATLDPNAPLHAGSWCKFCPAQAFCPEVKRYAIEVARHDFAAVNPPAAETLPIEIVADVLTKVEVLEHWVASLRARVQAELEAGRPVPGWKLVTKRPTRTWNAIGRVVDWWVSTRGLGSMDDLYNREIKSPAQVEAMVGKKNLPAELYSLVSSGVRLAPEHDRRPAVKAGPQEDFAPALPPGSAVTVIHTEGETQ